MTMIRVFLATALLAVSLSASADYFLYNDDLRKEGQTVEEAREAQMEAYYQRLSEKYRALDRRWAELNKQRQDLRDQRIEARKAKKKGEQSLTD